MSGTQVHRTARAILDYWLREVPPEKRFAKDEAIDRAIAERFGAAHDAIVASGAAEWRDDPAQLLAAVIAVDQFSRNLFRDDARAFAGDPLARELTGEALDKGWDAGMSAEERQFLYMPLMHSEDIADQDRSVALYATLGLPEAFDFAKRHRDQIAQFGRFPGRNAALGRESTPQEIELLKQPGSAF